MSSKETVIQPTARSAGLDIALQDIVDSIEDELLVIDNKYRIRFANSVVQNRYQKGAKSPIGKRCYNVLYNRNKPCSTSLWDCALRKVLQSGKMTTVIHPVRIRGAETYLKVTAYPLPDSSGNMNAVLELRRDVTAERELEVQILKRHHQLSALSQISDAISGLQDLDTILNIALDNVLEIINGAIGGILLIDEDTEKLYYRVHHGLSTTYAREMQIPLGEGIAGKVVQTGEPIVLEDISKDPRTVRPDLVSVEGLKGFISIPLMVKDKVAGVMNLASHEAGRFSADDVSLLGSIGKYLGTAIERAKLHEQLVRVGERYRTLLQHALNAQEEERKRIARELHDETSQAITSLTLSLQAVIGMAEAKGIGDDEFLDRLKITHSYAVRAGNEIVKIVKELRPTLLDQVGMPSAIQRYAKDTLQAQGINVSTDYKGADQRFPPEIEVTLFRVAQGAIGNILEHSGAKNAFIRLECNTSECVLRIDDDGQGFDVNRLTRVESSGRGAGLFTMKERVSLVGGECNVDSRPGKGTKITVKVPLVGDVINEED